MDNANRYVLIEPAGKSMYRVGVYEKGREVGSLGTYLELREAQKAAEEWRDEAGGVNIKQPK